MLFVSPTSIFLGVVFARGALAALTADQVVTNIGIVTQVSGSITSAVAGITTTSNGGQIQTLSQTVVTGFSTIITDLSADVSAMEATPPFDDDAAGLVVNALTDFVEVHQLLLSTLIGKHAIFAQFGVTAPIAAVLRSLEAMIDSFAFAMIALIPTRQGDVQDDKTSLDQSVNNSIDTFTQICIPSLLFPTLMPICIASL